VISALGSRAARNLDLAHESVGVILIGHGAPWEERCNLAAHFREMLPGVPIVASLRERDKDVSGADYNCPADNPLCGFEQSLAHSSPFQLAHHCEQSATRNLLLQQICQPPHHSTLRLGNEFSASPAHE